MTHQFPGKDHSISLDEAKKMIMKFRENKDKIVKDEFKGKHLIPNCESFDRKEFDNLLRREDCKGIRIYYGMKEGSDSIHAIIVAFDAEGKDILPVEGAVTDSNTPSIIENAHPCPPYCPVPSDINPL